MLAVGVPLIAALAVIVISQQQYWGDWLPNTYRLKMDGVVLLDRLERGAVTAGRALPVVALAATGCWIVARRYPTDSVARRMTGILTVMSATLLLYSVWVGGDAWEHFGILNRYVAVALPAVVAVLFVGAQQFVVIGPERGRRLSPVLVVFVLSALGFGLVTSPMRFDVLAAVQSIVLFLLVVLLVSMAVRDTAHLANRRKAVVIVSAALLFLVSTSVLPWRNFVAAPESLEIPLELDRIASGLDIAEVTRIGATVAVVAAGSEAYYGDRAMVDLLGKSDRHIATGTPVPGEFSPGHSKADLAYSLGKLRPDLLWLEPTADLEPVMRANPWGYVRRCARDGRAFYVQPHSPFVTWSSTRGCTAL